jgi:hypothetical protein
VSGKGQSASEKLGDAQLCPGPLCSFRWPPCSVLHAVAELRAAAHLCQDAAARIEAAANALSTALEDPGKAASAAADALAAALDGPGMAAGPAPMRQERRAGVTPRIDADPELEAFIRARIDHMSFARLGRAVAEAFPPERRVHPATIHRWWQRQTKRDKRTLRRGAADP